MFAKRVFDVLASAVGLIVLSPVFLVIAIAIKRESPGPVFFRQERVGLHGCPFLIHKFRTMRLSSDGPLITIGADRRITRSGALLRRLKLDELAQLIDVFRGTMSLVGPRPEVPKYVALYPEDIKRIVLSVRPGITDLASIEYRDENALLGKSDDAERTYIEEVMPAKLAFCVKYVRNRSFMLDLRIIFRTFAAVFG
ncbi:glycosyl transferase [Pandoraea sp. NE5]|uniref:sugar transferase n=1 Tax=unclassified Pandoraea TaxID=2624094 RepID=UPI00034625B4|nr:MULTISPECIES: sugar transferase [unclassified Pandoraea]BDD92205.1 glycosyl transferase [Pandoraea sp. NE5]